MISTETLLEPITPENPCGVDVAYDAKLQELETEILGKPETQFSQAEEPNWGQILEHAEAIFRRSKNLRVAIFLTVGSLQVEGLPGARAGLALLHGLIDQYWDGVYPRLDPDDNNDPLERINILSALVMPVGSFADPLRFLDRLRRAPVCRSPRLGIVSASDLLGTPAGSASAQVRAVFQDSDPAALAANHQALSDSIALVKALGESLDQRVGAARSIDWAPLLSILADIEKAMRPFVPGAAAPTGEVATTPAQSEGSRNPALEAVPGTIQSRADVVQALERICQFYRSAEPSSPVPLLLRRAQRLAEMDFLQIIENISPEALSQIRTVIGEAPPSEPPAASQ
jgi:type VI secretion system protein ImpA